MNICVILEIIMIAIILIIINLLIDKYVSKKDIEDLYKNQFEITRIMTEMSKSMLKMQLDLKEVKAKEELKKGTVNKKEQEEKEK